MLNSFKNDLVLAQHTDNVELGLGGTITKFIENNAKGYSCGIFNSRAICARWTA